MDSYFHSSFPPQGFQTNSLKHADVKSLALMALEGDFPDIPGPAVNALEETLNIKVHFQHSQACQDPPISLLSETYIQSKFHAGGNS